MRLILQQSSPSSVSGEKNTDKPFPRLVKILLSEHATKEQVLTRHREVFKQMVIFQGKSFSTYLRDDYTELQRELKRKLKSECQSKNQSRPPGDAKHFIVTRNFQLKLVPKMYKPN